MELSHVNKKKKEEEEGEVEGEAYQERGDGGVSEGAEAAEVGVRDEGADERREVGGAGEDVDDVGRRHLLDVEALHQVHRQVGRQPVRRHPLEALISCARSKHLPEVAAKLSSSAFFLWKIDRKNRYR